MPKAGQTADALRLKARQAQIDLASWPPSRAQALDLTRALVSNWTGDLADDRLDAIARIWGLFPLPVGAACVHPWTGIASTKIKDPRSGELQPRRFVPSNPEIRQWCNDYVADLHDAVKASERAEWAIQAPPVAPERQPPSPDEVARVQRIVDDIRERCNRVLGIPTERQRRECAERILEMARQR